MYPLYNRHIVAGVLIARFQPGADSDGFDPEVAEESAESEGMPPLPLSDLPE